MKELIGIAIIISTLFGGTKLTRTIHSKVRAAALEKAGKGLPPLGKLKFTSKDQTEN